MHATKWGISISTLAAALDSVLTSLGGSAIQGEQLSGPHGNQRYLEGSLGTDKGYTGQFVDAVTGLDYYNARWYDPVSGRFLSPDTVQGNAQGMDPYAYVEGNPETRTDPTGQRLCDPTGYGGCKPPPTKNPPADPTGGCGSGRHLTDSGCAPDGSTCPSGMQSGKGGCDYTGGDCRGLTYNGCQQFKQKQRKEEEAYQDAAKARDHFQFLANLFEGPLALMGQLVIDFILNALGWISAGPIGSLVANIVGGVLAGLSVLGMMAGDLAQVFRGETNEQDLRSGPGYSWFTRANLAADGSQIQNVITSVGGMFETGGSAFSAYTVMDGLLAGGIVGFSKVVLSFIAGGASFGIAMAVTVAAGAAVLSQQAQGYLNQEEADLS